MKLLLFTIHDSKADAFLQPFSAQNVATATRMFTHAVNDPDTDFSKWPGDYTLFELGEFNQQTGMTTFHKSPKSIGLGVTFIKASPTLTLTTPKEK